jgi:hypothetical protein
MGLDDESKILGGGRHGFCTAHLSHESFMYAAELISNFVFLYMLAIRVFVEAFPLVRAVPPLLFTTYDQDGSFISQARAMAQGFPYPILGFTIITRASSDSLACFGGECARTLARRYQR